MKNSYERSHELENNTNDFAIRVVYILRHTIFAEGISRSTFFFNRANVDLDLKFILQMMKVIMRQKKYIWGGSEAPQKFLRIQGGFSRFFHRIYMHFPPNMKDNEVSDRGASFKMFVIRSIQNPLLKERSKFIIHMWSGQVVDYSN